MTRKSQHTPNERLVRKRLAARLRQRRCRERKRTAALAKAEAAKLGCDSVKVDGKPATQGMASSKPAGSNTQMPPLVPPRMPYPSAPVYPLPAPNTAGFRIPYPPAFLAQPPRYPPVSMMDMPSRYSHMGIMPRNQVMPHFPQQTLMNHPPRRRYPVPVLVHAGHPQFARSYAVPAPRRTYPSEATAMPIPRTVSRSASEASMDSDASTKSCPKNKPNSKNRLATEEKTAVAAILSLKESSEEESFDELSAADDSTIQTAPSATGDESSLVLPSNLNQAFSAASGEYHISSRPRVAAV